MNPRIAAMHYSYRWQPNHSSGRFVRIVLSNIGTFGDINPLIALALELKRRGHVPVLALPNIYRTKIEPLSIEFRAIRPDIDPTDSRLIAMVYDVKKGTETGLREFLFPVLRQTYDDLLEAATQPVRADLLLLGELNYAGPLVAEITGIPWASYVLAPLSFFSAFDPPVLPPYPRLARADRVAGMGRVMKRLARFTTRKWPEPIYDLRRELGLSRGTNPLFDAKHSPNLVLALFSRVLGVEQKDWPPHALITGFCFYDADAGNAALPPHLEQFVSAGAPPVVFTLGSAAVLAAGDFYEISARAAKRLGVRAVLLIGNDPRNRPRKALPDSICVAEYAPYSALFSRCALVVHQGGVGTTAQCLRAGKPMLIMPYSHDQPDNARRMRRLKVSRTIQKSNYKPARVARKLQAILDEPEFLARAQQVAEQIAHEDGARTACDALEALYQKSKAL
ncbi:MAG TPA: glycosyltransferase [Terracidiphilus sp.]|nr:glycosyltransferase [Terracidiphilus sp.]